MVQNLQSPARLRRADSFFGVHFDFHAGEDSAEIGAHTTRESIENVIRQVRPDYIQCDCKGHPGLSSYPTKVGNPAPGIAVDALRLWREVTAEHGVALFMHYSGVWDTAALKKHPEWARINETGESDPNFTSVFGPYVDELLIPQLKELCDVYDVDGVWVDGDCWGARRDYAEPVLAVFKAQTGIQSVPRQPGQAGYVEFSNFNREGFLSYLRHYVDALHHHNPNFQVASNWSFTSFMPEPVSANVDFLSGDFTLQNSVNSARVEGRCLVHQGKPWDLMAWGFSTRLFQPDPAQNDPAFCTKSAVQLMQEAATVLALGGGFQAYFTQKRDGSLREYQMKVLAQVAEFCRARQPFCHHARPIPQVGLVYSKEALYAHSPALFQPNEQIFPMRGVLQGLLDNQVSVEVLAEHQLTGRMKEYQLLVVPEWDLLTDSIRAELLEYTRAGGSLLLVGPRSAALFQQELGITFMGQLVEKTERWLEWGGLLTGLSNNAFRPARLDGPGATFGRLLGEDDLNGPSDPGAVVVPFGRGKLAATFFDFGVRYLRGETCLARDFLGGLVRDLFPRPLVEVKGSHRVDVMLNQLNGQWMLNLLNTGGPHANFDVYTYDEVPPLGPLEITLRTAKRPSGLRLEPEGRGLPFSYENNEVHVTLPRLEIHAVLVVEE